MKDMKKLYMLIISALLLLPSLSSCDNDWEEPSTFSSAMWYASKTVNVTTGEYAIDINEPLIFWDISHECLAHSWTVSEGLTYVTGDLDVSFADENWFKPYLPSGEQPLTTTADKITVFSSVVGVYTITVRNEFATPVTYRDSSGDIESVLDEATGRYVIEHTYTINVQEPEEDEE